MGGETQHTGQLGWLSYFNTLVQSDQPGRTIYSASEQDWRTDDNLVQEAPSMRSRLSGFDASRFSISFVAPIDSTMRLEKSDAPR
jgi:hypothetical protein